MEVVVVGGGLSNCSRRAHHALTLNITAPTVDFSQLAWDNNTSTKAHVHVGTHAHTTAYLKTDAANISN